MKTELVDLVEETRNDNVELEEGYTGGYVELIDAGGEVKDVITEAWTDWRDGPETKKEDIALAKKDFIKYVIDVAKKLK